MNSNPPSSTCLGWFMIPIACLHSRFCLGAGMVLTSWECQGTNPGKLASLPALGLVTFGDALLMGCLSLAFVVDSCRVLLGLPCSLPFYVPSSMRLSCKPNSRPLRSSSHILYSQSESCKMSAHLQYLLGPLCIPSSPSSPKALPQKPTCSPQAPSEEPSRTSQECGHGIHARFL